jgi:glycosyltransferase involved in cell wall biosynthesis
VTDAMTGAMIDATIGAIADVVRGEGFASALRRTRERIGETVAHNALRAASLFASTPKASIVNVSATPVVPRNGGVQIQLITRLRAERKLREVALLHPGELLTSNQARRIDARDFEAAVREALSITGANAIHIEGMSGVPLDAVLRLIDGGVRVVITAHDFALFCEQPHLIEQSTNRFCFYSRDVERCRRCYGDQSERRELARTLLTSAAGVIFPSRFLLEKHRELFALPDLAAEVIEPPVPIANVRVDGPRREIACVGSVKVHKGGLLLPDIARALAARDARLHVFGGGDRELLQPLRRLSNVVIHGYYASGTLPSRLARHGIGLVVLASIWPETYSLTLSESWLAGASAAAFDLGAIAERIQRDGGGWLAPLESGADGLIAIIERWMSGATSEPPSRALPSPDGAAHGHMDLYRKWRL